MVGVNFKLDRVHSLSVKVASRGCLGLWVNACSFRLCSPCPIFTSWDLGVTPEWQEDGGLDSHMDPCWCLLWTGWSGLACCSVGLSEHKSLCAYGALCDSLFVLSRHLQGRELASRTFLRPCTRASRNFHFPVHPQSGPREQGAQLRVISPILSPPGKPQFSCLVWVRPCYLWIPPARRKGTTSSDVSGAAISVMLFL